MVVKMGWKRVVQASLLYCGLCTTAFAQQSGTAVERVQISAGVPLHVRVVRKARLRTGAAVHGVLTEPVYVQDRLVLPIGTKVEGSITAVLPADHTIRIRALLNGDFTPLHDPVVNFRTAMVDGKELALDTRATIRTVQLVNFTPGGPRPSLWKQAKTFAGSRIRAFHETFLAPGKGDRALKFVYGQLPYHPQNLWAGTQLVADLQDSAQVELPVQNPPTLASSTSETLDRIEIKARLIRDLNSDSAKKGDPVSAVITEPVFTPQHELLLPEGTRIDGTVMQAKASRSFGRNGQLRFVFRSVTRENEAAEQVHGTLTAAEGNKSQNLTVDHEGSVKSNPDKNRILAPLTLAFLAARGHDRDGGIGSQGIASNGFGIVARIIAVASSNKNIAIGFGAYAFTKSIYFRFLSRGHAITFPKDTLVAVELEARR